MHFLPGARRSLRLPAAAAVATIIGLVPAVFVATPAFAAVGDMDFTSDQESVEGDQFVFDLVREGGGAAPKLDLTFTTIDGTAEAGKDYTPISGSFSFAANPARDVTKRFVINGIGDLLDEDDETFTLQVTATPSGGGAPTVVTAQAVLDDDDATPSYTLESNSPVAENGGNAKITARLSAVSGRTVTIPIATSDDTAVAPDDYTATNNTITIQAGDPTGFRNIAILDDAFDEEDTESFKVTGSAGNHTEAAPGSPLVVDITDNDAMPTVNIGSPGAITEGGQIDFPVTLSAASNRVVKVLASTEAGTATAADYTPFSSQMVTFNPGDTNKLVSVQTTLDNLNEVNPEQFKVKLAAPSLPTLGHYTAGTMEGTGSITDDDNPPVASLSPATLAEGTATRDETFTVTLDAPSGREVKVGYAVQSGTATEGEDFEAVTAGELTFPAGTTTQTFTVKVKGDQKYEADENFMVTLSNAAGTASLAQAGIWMVALTNDDAKPSVTTFPDLTMAEGNTTVNKTIQVSLSNPSYLPITLDVTTTDDSAVVGGSGPGSHDFDAPTSTVTIQPGQTTATVTVPVNGDTVFEPNEHATIKVATQGSDTAVTASDMTSNLTLTNDDAAPTVVLAVEPGKKEGQTAAVTANVTGVSQEPIPVTLTAVGDAMPGGDAAQPADFDASNLLSTTSLLGGVISNPRTIGTIALLDDLIDENPQTVKVSMTGAGTVAPVWLTIADADDDLLPTIVPAASPAQHDEADGTVQIPVALVFGQPGNNATSTERKITAAWTTADGTAKKPADYTSTPGTVEFDPGVLSADIPVAIAPDTIYERTENFMVNLSGATPAGAVIAPTSTTVEILDDDNAEKPVLNQLGAPVTPFREGSPGTADFTVQLDRTATEPVDVKVWVTDGTAKHGFVTPGNDDYVMPATPVTIPAGEDKVVVHVTINNDTVYETAESATVHVELAAGENDAVDAQSPVTATLAITDDEAMPTVVLSPITAAEGSGPQAVVGTVTGVSQDGITVTVSAAGAANGLSDPAEAPDFDTNGLGTTSIPGGLIANGTVNLGTISFNDDQADEYDETARITLSGLAAPVTTWATITDDPNDLSPAVKIALTGTVAEDNGPVLVPATLDFTGSGDATTTQKTITAVYGAVNGTARAPGDFTAPTAGSKVTFLPGDLSKDVPIAIVNDEIFERDETFTVKLSAPLPAGVSLGNDVATVTVTDDDGNKKPTFSVTNAPFTEGAAGGKAIFTVNLSYASTQAVDLDVAMNDDTAVRAGNGPGYQDYTLPATTVTVPAGQSSVTIEVPVNDDLVYEGATTEKATLSVSLAQGEDDATGPTATGDLVITDNENKPTFTLAPSSGTEGSDVKVVATVTGTTQNDVPFDITIDGDSSEGNNPAEEGDYSDNGVSGTIPGGTVTGKVLTLGTITLNQDQIDEPAEFFRVTATDPDDGDRYVSALYRINDDQSDKPPTIAVDETTTIDEDEGTVDVHVKLVFDSDNNDATSTEQVLSVGWKTSDGTAKAGYDYSARTGTLTFQPGVTDLSANVPIVNDVVDEASQAFWVTLSGPAPNGVMISADTGQVQIMDNDATTGPTLTAPATRTGSGPVPVTGVTAEGAQVRIYAAAPSTPAKWFLAATATANAYGIYTASVPFDMGYYLQARVGSSTSPTRLVKVVQVPVLTATSTTAGVVNLTVAGNPKQIGLGVTIQRKNANGTWSTVVTGTTAGTAKTFAYGLRGQRSGTTMTFRAVIAANATWGTNAGTSAEKAVRVR